MSADAESFDAKDAEPDLIALDQRIAEWKAEVAARDRAPRARLWLTHHHAPQHDRCWLAGNTLVCRRCTLLWPLAFVVLATVGWGSWWPASADPWLLVLLPLPGVIEFTLEHFGIVRYSSRRQLLLTIPVAVAIGRLLWRYLDDPRDGLFWVIVWGYAVAMFAAAVVGHRRGRAADRTS